MTGGRVAEQTIYTRTTRKALEAVYAQRHDGSTDGLEEVIKSASAAPAP